MKILEQAASLPGLLQKFGVDETEVIAVDLTNYWSNPRIQLQWPAWRRTFLQGKFETCEIKNTGDSSYHYYAEREGWVLLSVFDKLIGEDE